MNTRSLLFFVPLFLANHAVNASYADKIPYDFWRHTYQYGPTNGAGDAYNPNSAYYPYQLNPPKQSFKDQVYKNLYSYTQIEQDHIMQWQVCSFESGLMRVEKHTNLAGYTEFWHSTNLLDQDAANAYNYFEKLYEIQQTKFGLSLSDE